MGCTSLRSPLSSHVLPSAILGHGSEIFATYYVTFDRQGNRDKFLMHLEVFPDHVSLVGLGALGEVLFECRYDKSQAEKCDTLVEGIPAVMLLQDIELIYWPLDELNSKIKHSSFSLTETAQRRVLLYRQRILSEITYEKERSLLSRVTLDNKKYNYQLHIEPLHVKREVDHE
ncbi:uncharacterized protein METZ01_LOCUS170521 [marine metagenome]|uniref:Uncharacterized protein n=1 Tax=marine metagenome TaxID=408172 RepID=A0A382BWT2_9ZZZZ